MCVVSMVTDHYMDKWPMWPSLPQPTLPSVPLNHGPMPHEFADYQELLRKVVK